MSLRAVKVPIRLFIILPIVAEVFLFVAVVGWLAIRNGQRAVNQVSQQLREETTAGINNEISDLLSKTEVVNQLSAQAVDRENLDLNNIRSVEDIYWDYINAFQTIQGLGVGNELGELMGVFKRVENGKVRYFLDFTDAQTPDKYFSLELNQQREIIDSSTTERGIDARERPWYRAAIAAEGFVWTDVYTSVSAVEGHTLAINAARPVFDQAGQLQGVVSVILDLGQVSQLLEAIEFSPSGQIYILEANGHLIGSSDGANPVWVNGEAVKRLPATASQTPLISSSAAFLETALEGGLGALDRSLQMEFELEGDRQFLQVTPIRARNQLEWFIVVVAPESDFMGPIYATTRTVVILCLVALVLVVAISVLTAQWITRPLLQLNRATKQVAQGRLQQGEHQSLVVNAQAREVGELANSFREMVKQLQAAFGQMQRLNVELADSESRLKQFLEALPVGASVHDVTGRITYINQVGKRLLGIEAVPEGEITQLVEILQVVRTADQQLYPIDEMPVARAFQGMTTYVDDMELRRDNRLVPVEVWGSPIFNERGEVVYAIAAFQDISDRKETEALLIHNALHDALTDLPNRSFLMKRLADALEPLQRDPTHHFAVLFLDLDQFKIINDSLGHLAGDQLLIVIAERLQRMIRPHDFVARLGGDEFVILLTDIATIREAVRMAERILTAFQGPTSLDERNIFLTTSIGLVFGTADYTEATAVMRDADIALYRAKAQGRARYAIFDADMHAQALKRMLLEQDLLQAIGRQEFVVYYQPIVTLQDQSLIGFEALIRWQHPTRGLIPPVEFIPVAEDTGLILAISQWMLEATCQQMATWRRQFPELHQLRVSVNLSSQDLREASLIGTVHQTLEHTGLPASVLTLEITESMLIDNVEVTINLLRELRSLGVRISIDDFGTGYSSLSYLYQLPADYLKIDKSFVANMAPGNSNYKIVQAIIALSHQMQLETIAEGVETAQELSWIRALGSNLGQGYYFSRPLATETTERLLNRQMAQFTSGAADWPIIDSAIIAQLTDE